MRDQDRHPPTTGNGSDVTADDLFRRIVEIINDARGRVTRTVNSAMVQAYWEIGRQIVEVEQQGDPRAGYGEQVLAGLSERLTRCFGRGFGVPHLRRIRQFYQVYPASAYQAPDAVDIDTQQIGAALRRELLPTVQPQFRQELGWTHYRLLMTIANPTARSFYETEAAREGWSCRELERQIASHLHERLTASRDKDDILALAHQGQEVSTPQDVVKDPLVLEFLGLSDRPHWHERDLEQAIIDHLQEFMLELGKGFSFVARQKRITLDGDRRHRAVFAPERRGGTHDASGRREADRGRAVRGAAAECQGARSGGAGRPARGRAARLERMRAGLLIGSQGLQPHLTASPTPPPSRPAAC